MIIVITANCSFVLYMHKEGGREACIIFSGYHRVPFSRATNVTNELKKEVQGNCFHEPILMMLA